MSPDWSDGFIMIIWKLNAWLLAHCCYLGFLSLSHHLLPKLEVIDHALSSSLHDCLKSLLMMMMMMMMMLACRVPPVEVVQRESTLAREIYG
jgi:hypothetical protein